MKKDHMKNGQLKPAYNMQIGVEGEYIVGVDVSSERSDQLTLIPFLDKIKEGLPVKYENVIADAGYESKENYKYLAEHNQTAYIKPQNYEKSKSKKFKNNISKRENMNYNPDEDYYICANGKKRMNRSIQVEGAFGVLKQDYGFRRFLLRGKKNIKTEFILLCFSYNIQKLFNKTIKNISGVLLHYKAIM